MGKAYALIMLITIGGYSCLWAQSYTASSIFAHNDYAQQNPFYNAYSNQVGFIEADIFLIDGELHVAHQKSEIKKEITLKALYLHPLRQEIIKNGGWAYADTILTLTLMIDLKTEGVSTLQKLVGQLNDYPELLNGKNFTVAISGNVPDPASWHNFPKFIHFDGRPNISYTHDQLARVVLISNSFGIYSRWDGHGTMPENDRKKIDALLRTIHGQGKRFRFWAAPDFDNGWQTLMNLNVDVIGSDHVSGIVAFVNR